MLNKTAYMKPKSLYKIWSSYVNKYVSTKILRKTAVYILVAKEW
jgi:hypothetical protein